MILFALKQIKLIELSYSCHLYNHTQNYNNLILYVSYPYKLSVFSFYCYSSNYNFEWICVKLDVYNSIWIKLEH